MLSTITVTVLATSRSMTGWEPSLHGNQVQRAPGCAPATNRMLCKLRTMTYVLTCKRRSAVHANMQDNVPGGVAGLKYLALQPQELMQLLSAVSALVS